MNKLVVLDQTPPVILAQPQNHTNPVATTANFTVTATACTPLVFQWFFNDHLLAGRTNGTLTIGSVSPTNAGNYAVVATASGGSATSAVAALTVNLIAPTLTLNSSTNPSGYKDNLNF